MAENIGTAYVQIEPSFDGVVSKIDKEFGGAGQSGGKSFGSGFASVLGTVGKVAAGAAAAGTAAVSGMVSAAVSGFSQYQQLVGGVETLFGGAADVVQEKASQAFTTAGLSANQYMETVTSFSASLIQSLGNDTEQAAVVADRAIIDMSDNANKMGTSMESIQYAYQGFAKQNYTMLDNLKLGYGGTKTEMERLIKDASGMEKEMAELGVTVDGSSMSFANIVNAISVVQKHLGIMGTTYDEAAGTVSGSMASMKAAWENVLTAMGTGDVNAITDNIEKLVATTQTYAQNMLPVIQNALQGVSTLIEKIGPEIAKALPDLVKNTLPGLMKAGVDIIKTLGEGIINAIPTLMPTITEVILELCRMLVDMLPELIQVGMEVILELAMGIAEALPELIPTIVETVLTIAEYLIDNVDLLIDAAIALIVGLSEGLINALPTLIEKAPEIVIKLVEAIIRNAPKILTAAAELILMFVEGIVRSWAKIFEVGRQIVDKVKSGFSDKVREARTWGSDMIQNFIDGIMAKFDALKSSVKRCAQAVKDFLGFSEPEEGPLSNFHTFAPDMMDLYAEGIRDNVDVVKSALTDATSDIMSGGVNMENVQNIQTSVNAADLSTNNDQIGRIENLLTDFIENFKQEIYLDTGALVGGTVNAYNSALGQLAIQGANR